MEQVRFKRKTVDLDEMEKQQSRKRFRRNMFYVFLFAFILILFLGTAFFLFFRVKEISVTIVGAEIKTERLLDYRSEGIVALCGPCVNLLLALLFGIPEWGHVFAGINLALGSLNLLPVHPLDGGRMLRAVLAYLIDASWADQVSECLGLVFSVLLCLFGGWITLCSGNITLLLVSAWMTSTYFKRKVCD